jgi:hypothetical protein
MLTGGVTLLLASTAFEGANDPGLPPAAPAHSGTDDESVAGPAFRFQGGALLPVSGHEARRLFDASVAVAGGAGYQWSDGIEVVLESATRR